jgi:hypothetical protein
LNPTSSSVAAADDAVEICCLAAAAAREWDRMCPARARGLAKRRKQSLHVVFAMARDG